MKNLFWLIVIVFLFMLGMMQSCTTANKALNYLAKHPEVGAQYCADKYPVKEIFIKGKDSIIEKTVTIKGDSVDCPPVVKGKDTVRVKVKCPDQKVVYQNVYRTDTVVKENTAKLAVLSNELDKSNQSLIKEKTLRENAEKEAKNRMWWLVGIVGLAIVYGFLRFKKILPF